MCPLHRCYTLLAAAGLGLMFAPTGCRNGAKEPSAPTPPPAAATLSRNAFTGPEETSQRRCGTRGAGIRPIKIHEETVMFLDSPPPTYVMRPPGSVKITVYFHVILRDDTAAVRSDLEQKARWQIKALNRAFGMEDALCPDCPRQTPDWPVSATPFTFELANDRVLFHHTSEWFEREPPDQNSNQPSPKDRACRMALRNDNTNKNVLHVFTVRSANPNVLGWASWPGDPVAFDGIVIDLSTLPQRDPQPTPHHGGVSPFGLGDTAVHEVGHWLGLRHVYVPGDDCSRDRDGIPDTPLMKEHLSVSACPPTYPDTCTSQPGRDPVENYMDETPDCCAYQFTKGQAEFMDRTAKRYRGL